MLVLVAFLCATDAPPPAPASTVAPAPATTSTPATTPAAPTSSPKRDTMLVLDVAGAEAEPAAKGLSDLLATTLLDKADLDVLAASTVRDRLAHATDKVEVGACDDAACMAEIAGATGARFVVYARLSTVSDKKLLRLEAFDERDARSVSVVTIRAPSVGAIYDEMPKAVAQLIVRSDGAIPARAASSDSPVVDAPGFFDKPGNAHLVFGGSVFGAGVVVMAAFAVTTFFALKQLGTVDNAVTAYKDEPNVKNAAALRDAKTGFDSVAPWQNLCGLGFVAAIPVVLGGGGVAIVGLKEKASE